MGNLLKLLNSLRPIMAMLLVQIGYAGLSIFFKIAIVDGINFRILVAYRLLFATLFVLPLALVFEREKRPKLTWKVWLLSFVSGLLGGTVANNLFIMIISLTSATFATASMSIIPGLTFITAVLFGLENLGLRSRAGLVKLVGTLFGVGGAFIFTLYRGPEINIWSTHMNILSGRGGHVAHSKAHPVVGTVVALFTYSCHTFWLLLQAKISKYIEGYYWNNFLTNIMGTIQSIGFALWTERDWKEWRLGWNIRLVAAIYSGIMISGICNVIISWCVRQNGPLYVSVFNPLSIVIVAFVGSLALDEQLYVGSIIGTILILGGLYMVLWGKSQEIKKTIISTVLSMKDIEHQMNTDKGGDFDRDGRSGGDAAAYRLSDDNVNVRPITYNEP